MNCKNCGSTISESAKFCPYCGTEVERSKFCEHCGKKISENATICPYCSRTVVDDYHQGGEYKGSNFNNEFSSGSGSNAYNRDANGKYTQNYNQNYNAQKGAREGDASSFGWAILGFFFPLIGLILYLVWKDEYPLRAASVGKGALVAVIIEVVVWILAGAIVGCASCLTAPYWN